MEVEGEEVIEDEDVRKRGDGDEGGDEPFDFPLTSSNDRVEYEVILMTNLQVCNLDSKCKLISDDDALKNDNVSWQVSSLVKVRWQKCP